MRHWLKTAIEYLQTSVYLKKKKKKDSDIITPQGYLEIKMDIL